MSTYRRLALITTAATYFLIFMGGLVRVAGAGMGCPDWPKCFGSWIPPLSIAQLPEGIDPASFNVVLAWIEYVNRLVGVSVGFLIVAAAILALIHFRSRPLVLWPTIVAVVLVAFQGWQGSVIVATELKPIVVSVHMILALVIAGLLIYATMRAYLPPEEDKRPMTPMGKYLVWPVAGLGIITAVQVLLGTQVRQALETMAMDFPSWSAGQMLSSVGAVSELHRTLGVAVLVLSIWVGVMIFKKIPAGPSLLRFLAWAVMVIALLQAIIGVVLIIADLPPLFDLFHLWLAAIAVGLLLVMFVAVRSSSAVHSGWPKAATHWLSICGAIVVVMAIVAWVVIDYAEQSILENAHNAIQSAGLLI
jgi:cytochrome c oxidase assembly protein subunit 15